MNAALAISHHRSPFSLNAAETVILFELGGYEDFGWDCLRREWQNM